MSEVSRGIRRERAIATGRALGRGVLAGVASIVAVVALWVGFLAIFGVSPYIGKGPIDVWEFLAVDPKAEANRATVFGALGQTLLDASIGFVAGLALAALIAVIFTLSRGAEHALLPLAMLLRSVPLVAMAPIIILIFGREQLSVAVMGAIVVLFPALVTIAFGLRSASPHMLDLVRVYGGNQFTALRKVAFPASLPSFFAAVKVSVPGAITGALLVEWLATGKGIGYGIVSAAGRAKFNEVWADVVVITAVSIVLYNVVAIIESAVLSRQAR